MAKEYAQSFYKSKRWNDCKNTYLSSIGNLCERCYEQGYMTPAKIVHHKIYISPSNIYNPEITLNWNNLEALCQDCHNKEHNTRIDRRYSIDDNGNIVISREKL